jgi:uncharacterized protein YkwD
MTATRVLRPARRALVSALAAALAALAAVGVVGAVAPSTATATTATTAAASAFPAMASSTYEQRVQHWINVRRSHHGLAKLRLQSCTDRVAENWGDYLATNDAFFHQSMGKILDRCHASYAGETLARGAVSPKRIVSLWMHSPGHRAILLSKYPRRVGIGAYPDRFGQWVVAADFTRF